MTLRMNLLIKQSFKMIVVSKSKLKRSSDLPITKEYFLMLLTFAGSPLFFTISTTSTLNTIGTLILTTILYYTDLPLIRLSPININKIINNNQMNSGLQIMIKPPTKQDKNRGSTTTPKFHLTTNA